MLSDLQVAPLGPWPWLVFLSLVVFLIQRLTIYGKRDVVDRKGHVL